MADNTQIQATTVGGDTYASDDIGGIKFQRIKLISGVDGTNDGDVAATNGLPIVGGNVARSSAAWTSATSLNTALTMTVTGYSTVLLTQSTTSTITGGAVTMEGSDDNSKWFPLSAQFTHSGVVHSSWNIAVADIAWFVSTGGFRFVRLRLSTVISGSGTSTVALTALAMASGLNPNPGIPRAQTATLSNVSSSASNVTLLALNDSRIGAIVHNDSTSTLYMKFGATASTTSYTYNIAPGGTWEMPTAVVYHGIIDGIWSSAQGSARITELKGI